jgi:hypothetical protein
MPKEKTTRKAAPKSKTDGGKKKKGRYLTCDYFTCIDMS